MEVRQRSTEIMQLTIEQEIQEDDISPYFWTPASIVAVVMVLYAIVHAILMTDGMLSTCKQYRSRVVKYVHATGQMVIMKFDYIRIGSNQCCLKVGVLQSRLSCAAIFDFMDYLHEDLSFERRRDYRINTAIPFILAVIAAWVVVFCWLGILIVNVMRFRQSRRVRI